MTENPPWVVKLLKEVWPVLLRRVTDPTLLPKDGPTTKDYGCGHYGCVLPTSFEDGQGNEIVCKITTDTSEAKFIQAALTLAQEDEWPAGMIRYFGVYRIPGKLFRKRPIYVIWREGAPDAAEVQGWASVTRSPESLNSQDVSLILLAKELAHKLRSRLGAIKGGKPDPGKLSKMHEALPHTPEDFYDVLSDHLRYPPSTYTYANSAKVRAVERWLKRLPRGGHGAARIYKALETCYQEMQNRSSTNYVGEALAYYLDENILLADVHLANIRLGTPEGYSGPINLISDPGHMVALDPRWDSIGIPVL